MDMTHLFETCPPQLPFVLVERKSRWEPLEWPRGGCDVTPGRSPRQISVGVPSLKHSCYVKPQCWVQVAPPWPPPSAPLVGCGTVSCAGSFFLLEGMGASGGTIQHLDTPWVPDDSGVMAGHKAIV